MQNCYNSAGVKPEEMNEQHERLTRKHIKTLGFMQDIVSENKDLKAQVEDLQGQLSKCSDLHRLAEESQDKIKEIQEKYMNRADEINGMMAEKHKVDMMERVDAHISAEQAWLQEKHQLMEEIEILQKEYKAAQGELAEMDEYKDTIQLLELKVDAQQQEIDRLRGEKEMLVGAAQNQVSHLQQIQTMQAENSALTQEISALKQQNKELQFKVEKLQKDLEDSGKQTETNDLINTLKRKLVKFSKEREGFSAKQKEYTDAIEELKAENTKLRKALTDSERMREESQKQVEILLQELTLLRKHSCGEKDKQTFRDFVQLKREVANLKDENEDLKIRAKFVSQQRGLPALKADRPQGHTKSSGSNKVKKSSSDSSTASYPAVSWK